MNKIRKAFLAAALSAASLIPYNAHAQNTIVLHDRSDIVADINNSQVFDMKAICDTYNGGNPAKFQGTGGTPGYINRTMKKLLKQSSVTLNDVLEPTVPLLRIQEMQWASNCELRKAVIEFLPGGTGPTAMMPNCSLGDSIFYTSDNNMNGLEIDFNEAVVEDCIFIGFGTGVVSKIYAPDTPCGVRYNLFAWNAQGLEVHYGINMTDGKNIFYRNDPYNAVINAAKSAPPTKSGYVFTIDNQSWYDRNGNFLTDKTAIGNTLNPPLGTKAGDSFTLTDYIKTEATVNDMDHNGIPDLDDREGFWNLNPSQDLAKYGFEVVNAEDPDNDGDGFSDALEVTLLHTDPLNPNSPNPLNPPTVPLSRAWAFAGCAAILYLGSKKFYQPNLEHKVEGSKLYTKP
jgi:hypothetical protein